MFRALGSADPPEFVQIGERRARRLEILKHDSWAATAIYEDDAGRRHACKFNRIQQLLFMPMAWVGRRLADRETRVMRLMAGREGFPTWSGEVRVDGRVLPNAVAHEWIEGRTFAPWLKVNDGFFPQLLGMVRTLHAHDLAYVDLAKWENLLVGDDGRPWLIDYQIHVHLPRRRFGRWFLSALQSADMYHLYRHWGRARPDQLTPAERSLDRWRPEIVRLAEAAGPFFRGLRLNVLRFFGVATDDRGKR